jgi:RNA polymerase sigma factor (sigma-70 family)
MEQTVVTIQNKEYKWDKQSGLEPAAVLAVEGWIKKTAKRYICWASAANCDMDDLIQAGTVGALKAAKTYCPNKGATFLSWAHLKIIDEMRCLCQHLTTADSLDVPNTENDLIDPSFDERKAELAIEVGQYLSMLTKDKRKLLIQRYGLENHIEHSLKGLSKKYALTQSAMHSRINKAINQIRRRLNLPLR